MWISIVHVLLLSLSAAMADSTDYLEVTLSVFSGIPDPVWKIESCDQHYQEIVNLVGNHSTPLAPILGYSGFIIDKYTGSTSKDTLTVGKCSNSNLETLLINTVEHRIPDGQDAPLHENVIRYARDAIESCPTVNK